MSLDRRALVAEVLAQRGDALVVSGLGSPSWDAFAAGDSDANFYLWGAMGLAVSTALGLAIAQPARRVLCLTGDGEMMMGIGSLAVVGAEAPRNLAILVLDNGSFGETGRQEGLTARGADIAVMARGGGIGTTLTITRDDEIAGLAEALFTAPGPVLAVAKIALKDHPLTLPERDGATLARRFRGHVGGS